jgi:hypothetical protein
LIEYSSTASGLSVPPYPSISGTTTRYPACTHGPIWCRQPYLTQPHRETILCGRDRHSPYVRKSVNAKDCPCRRRCRFIVRVTHRLLIDKVIRSPCGKLFGAVVEARWVNGVHEVVAKRRRVRTLPRVSHLTRSHSPAIIHPTSNPLHESYCRQSTICPNDMLPSQTVPRRALDLKTLILQPRAKETDHSNGGWPTLTRFCLPAICDNVIGRMPCYLRRAG